MGPEETELGRLLDSATKEHLLAAAKQAERVYPGPVGQLLRQELLSWMVFGHQLGSRLIMQVADAVTEQPATRQDESSPRR